MKLLLLPTWFDWWPEFTCFVTHLVFKTMQNYHVHLNLSDAIKTKFYRSSSIFSGKIDNCRFTTLQFTDHYHRSHQSWPNPGQGLPSCFKLAIAVMSAGAVFRCPSLCHVPRACVEL